MKSREKGQVLVLFALAVVALLGFAALGIDVGYMYSVRHELQRSADAGALAGASAFFDGDWASPGIRAVADTRARDFASRDAVSLTPLNPGSEVSVSYPAQDRIRVDTQRTVNLFFARVLGRQNQNITAFATAEARIVNQRLPCIKPWGIPYPWTDTNGDGKYTPPDEAIHYDCPDGVNPAEAFCQGTTLILKIGTPSGKKDQPDVPSLQQEPGHFFALDFGSGAKSYKEAIKGGCDNTVEINIGQEIPLEPGNMVGPTVQAVTTDGDSLINQDPTSHWVDTPDGGLPESDTYRISDGSWMNSPRVVRIPVYDPSEPLQTGKTDMRVAGFAGFWVERADKKGNQGTVFGRFIPMSAFGGSSGPLPGPNPGPVLRMLRLVE